LVPDGALRDDPRDWPDWAAQNEVEYVEMRALLQESDIITLHAPLTPQTDRIINHETLALMKSGVILANTSRGRLIHTQALIRPFLPMKHSAKLHG
jgi:D-lactate dehydrogenase